MEKKLLEHLEVIRKEILEMTDTVESLIDNGTVDTELLELWYLRICKRKETLEDFKKIIWGLANIK